MDTDRLTPWTVARIRNEGETSYDVERSTAVIAWESFKGDNCVDILGDSWDAVADLDAQNRKLKDCDARLAKYRAAIEAGTDPTIVGQLIAEVQSERLAAERAPAEATPPQATLTMDEVRVMVEGLGDIVKTLEDADPATKAHVYRDLGVKLTYHPEGTVEVTARPRVDSGACRRTDILTRDTANPQVRAVAGLRDRCSRNRLDRVIERPLSPPGGDLSL